eukprot:GHVS01054623.1.p1 GENE.GHVS01054623.1~~GHVS01054623.1.p1  ORF type:complete len:441 (+),score=42.43 GHVS01054623.1:136-1458(+)
MKAMLEPKLKAGNLRRFLKNEEVVPNSNVLFLGIGRVKLVLVTVWPMHETLHLRGEEVEAVRHVLRYKEPVTAHFSMFVKRGETSFGVFALIGNNKVVVHGEGQWNTPQNFKWVPKDPWHYYSGLPIVVTVDDLPFEFMAESMGMSYLAYTSDMQFYGWKPLKGSFGIITVPPDVELWLNFEGSVDVSKVKGELSPLTVTDKEGKNVDFSVEEKLFVWRPCVVVTFKGLEAEKVYEVRGVKGRVYNKQGGMISADKEFPSFKVSSSFTVKFPSSMSGTSRFQSVTNSVPSISSNKIHLMLESGIKNEDDLKGAIMLKKGDDVLPFQLDRVKKEGVWLKSKDILPGREYEVVVTGDEGVTDLLDLPLASSKWKFKTAEVQHHYALMESAVFAEMPHSDESERTLIALVRPGKAGLQKSVTARVLDVSEETLEYIAQCMIRS